LEVEVVELLLTLDRAAATPLWRQVYLQLRERILAGELRAGERLPSTRALAVALGVSRNLILDAYAQLQAEGYLLSRPQSGMLVAALATPLLPELASEPTARREPAQGVPPIDFRPGLPALEHVPRRIWGQLLLQICRESDAQLWGYGVPEGDLSARQALVRYLGRMRGVRCSPEQIVMTTGAAQAFAIVAELCLRPGSCVLGEDPMTADIRLCYAATGARFCPVPVDGQGLAVEQIAPDLAPQLIHVTPSHQFPLGGVLPIARRLALTRLARERGSWIVEDDYDSEIRYSGAPIPALQGLAPEQVIYVGTLSKILAPALRLGYLIVPTQLVADARAVKRQIDLHSPTIDHRVLARFIDEGHLDRHLRRVKRVYRQRRDALLAALAAAAPAECEVWGASTGIHLVVAWPGRRFTPAWVAQLERDGVRVYLVERHALEPGAHNDKLILGYGHLAPEQIAAGVARLLHALPARDS
jgi:GntR family transcriptional regulator / MocR family aminotransferase